MAWFRRSPPPCRIFLHRADGRELRRELAPSALDPLIRRMLEQGGAAAAKAWERSGQFHSAAVLAAWPAHAARPERALLGRGAGDAGSPWLEAAFGPGAPLTEIAEDLERALLEKEPIARVHAEAVAVEPALAAPVPPPAPAPAPTSAPARTPALVPSRTVPTLRPILQARAPEDGLFLGLAQDVLDAGVDVRPADLPGLDRGDRLHSPRRGSCVVLQPAAGPDWMLLRDERGREIQVSHAELTAEFSFDDPADEPHAV